MLYNYFKGEVMTLFAYDPPDDDGAPRRSFDGYDPSSTGSTRRDPLWLNFRINGRMQRVSDRSKHDEEEVEEFERDMLALSLSSYKPTGFSFGQIGNFLGATLFGARREEYSYEQD